jgi:prepilin-type N-terminal cleavage/methylation domain-containing protein
MAQTQPITRTPSGFHTKRFLSRGFSLVEMLVVMAVISVLLTAAGPVFESLTSSQRPATVASAVAGQLERARSHAMARNTHVWVRLGKVAEEPNDFFVGVYESLDGTQVPSTSNIKGSWTAPRFSNISLTGNLAADFSRPSVPAADRPEAAVWIRFSPGGEAWTVSADPMQSRIKMIPPPDEGVLSRWIEIGLQPTRGGVVSAKLRTDVASVQIAGLTGQALAFSR